MLHKSRFGRFGLCCASARRIDTSQGFQSEQRDRSMHWCDRRIHHQHLPRHERRNSNLDRVAPFRPQWTDRPVMRGKRMTSRARAQDSAVQHSNKCNADSDAHHQSACAASRFVAVGSQQDEWAARDCISSPTLHERAQSPLATQVCRASRSATPVLGRIENLCVAAATNCERRANKHQGRDETKAEKRRTERRGSECCCRTRQSTSGDAG